MTNEIRSFDTHTIHGTMEENELIEGTVEGPNNFSSSRPSCPAKCVVLYFVSHIFKVDGCSMDTKASRSRVMSMLASFLLSSVWRSMYGCMTALTTLWMGEVVR